MAREKHVFDTHEVPHVWARQTQDDGRNPQGNLYFTGDTIYSYGGHFPIARIVKRNGATAILFTTRSYSSTTNGHTAAVRGAIRHFAPIFHVQHPTENPTADSLKEYESTVAELLAQAARARSYGPSLYAQAVATIDEANRFSAFFGLRRRLKQPADIESALADARERTNTEKRRNAKLEAVRAKRVAEADAERAAWFANALHVWLAGGNPDRGVWRFYSIDPAYLRIDPAEPNMVQTSAGARVPLAVAERAYRRMSVGADLGGYRISDVTTDVVKVGCHTFQRSEVERFARSVGWSQAATPQS